MKRVTGVLMLGAVLLLGWPDGAFGADLKVIQTQKTKNVTITLMNESGQLTKGKNNFILEFTATDKQPVDVGKVTFHTTMSMPGMAPMTADATLGQEKPGRYRATIEFPDTGTRQVTLTWDGPTGKGSAKFSLPVR